MPKTVTILLIDSCNVRRILVKATEIILCQMADLNSFKYLLSVFEEFYRYAGLKLNQSKSEVYVIQGKQVFHKESTLAFLGLTDVFNTSGSWFLVTHLRACTI